MSALGAVRARIAQACRDADRDPQSVTLIAVTKTYPAADVAIIARLGVPDVGESKDQEARAKLAQLHADAADAGGPDEPVVDVRWHVVGRLQTNKANSVVNYAHAVHSVDRAKLVRALGDAARTRSEPLEVFVQVSLDGDPARGGIAVADVARLCDAVADRAELRLRGLMAVVPLGAEPDPAFDRLAAMSHELRAMHPAADAISAGMSGDLESAVAHGSTHVRVGSALLGRRAPLIG